MKCPLHVKQRFISAIVVMCLFSLIPVGLGHLRIAVVESLPHTHWFEYKSVTSCFDTYDVGDVPMFESVSRVKRETNFEWYDTLYCDTYNGRGFAYYSQYVSTSHGSQPRGWESKKWAYHGAVPNEPATCYLRTTIKHLHGSGKEKTQVLEDNTKTFKFE